MITFFRLYITYTKRNPQTDKIYVGMASGLVSAISLLSIEWIRKRCENAPHHKNKEGFKRGVIDKVSTIREAIRGREQMLYEHFEKQGRIADQNQPVSPRNPKRTEYIKMALAVFGDISIIAISYFLW